LVKKLIAAQISTVFVFVIVLLSIQGNQLSASCTYNHFRFDAR